MHFRKRFCGFRLPFKNVRGLHLQATKRMHLRQRLCCSRLCLRCARDEAMRFVFGWLRAGRCDASVLPDPNHNHANDEHSTQNNNQSCNSSKSKHSRDVHADDTSRRRRRCWWVDRGYCCHNKGCRCCRWKRFCFCKRWLGNNASFLFNKRRRRQRWEGRKQQQQRKWRRWCRCYHDSWRRHYSCTIPKWRHTERWGCCRRSRRRAAGGDCSSACCASKVLACTEKGSLCRPR